MSVITQIIGDTEINVLCTELEECLKNIYILDSTRSPNPLVNNSRLAAIAAIVFRGDTLV